MKVTKCGECGYEISIKTDTCPNCGEDIGIRIGGFRGLLRRLFILVIAAYIILEAVLIFA